MEDFLFRADNQWANKSLAVPQSNIFIKMTQVINKMMIILLLGLLIAQGSEYTIQELS